MKGVSEPWPAALLVVEGRLLLWWWKKGCVTEVLVVEGELLPWWLRDALLWLVEGGGQICMCAVSGFVG
jgi:hypothetical protein